MTYLYSALSSVSFFCFQGSRLPYSTYKYCGSAKLHDYYRYSKLTISSHHDMVHPSEERYYFKLNIRPAVTATTFKCFSNQCTAVIRASSLSTALRTAIRITRVSKDESFIRDSRAAGLRLQPRRTAPFPCTSTNSASTTTSSARITRFKYVVLSSF